MDWGIVGQDVIKAVESTLGKEIRDLAPNYKTAIENFIEIGKDLETALSSNPPTITPLEYQNNKAQAQNGLKGFLLFSAAAAEVMVAQAATAAWSVVETALVAAFPVTAPILGII
jgi:hypothetical protein